MYLEKIVNNFIYSMLDMFPKLAAQHLIDGLPIELVDGDSNMVNLEWIRATFHELEDKVTV